MPSKTRIIGAIFSILLHLVTIYLLIAVTNRTDTNTHSSPKSQSINVVLIPNKPEIPIKEINEINGNKSIYGYRRDSKICNGKEKTYIGVGFMWQLGTQLIIYAPEDYPAYKAGTRVGDMLVNPDSEVTNGYMDFDVIRYSEKLHFHVKAENICFRDG